MKNRRKEQTRAIGHEDDKDRQPADTLDPGVGEPAPDRVSPILQSEDNDELVDEDAPD